MIRLLMLAWVTAQEPAAEPKMHVVRKATFTPVLQLEAVFEPAQAVDVKLRFDAYQGDLTLARVAAHGQRLGKGDVVLALDPEPIARQLAAAEIDLRVARATLAKEQADADLGARADAQALERAQTELKDAETNLKVFDDVDGKHMLLNADLSVKSSQDYVSDQQEELDQLLKMYKSEELTNATSEIVVRRAQRALERAKTRLTMEQADSRVTKEVRHPERRRKLVQALDSAKLSLESVKITQALAKVQREAAPARAKAALESAERLVARLRKDQEAFTVHAPYDGVLTYGQWQDGQWSGTAQALKQLVPGEKLMPQQVLATFCAAPVRVAAVLPEASYYDVFPDQAGTVAPVASPDAKLEARLVERTISGPTYIARLELVRQRPDLLPGMKAKVTLTGKELKDVLVVPAGAISATGAKSAVTVCKDGKNATREIVVGGTDGTLTHVKGGLEEGEAVVLPK
jgi:multidrug resistance efflux pump